MIVSCDGMFCPSARDTSLLPNSPLLGYPWDWKWCPLPQHVLSSLYPMHRGHSTLCLIFIPVPLKCLSSACGVGCVSSCVSEIFHLHPYPPQRAELPKCPSLCPTMTGRNRFQWGASLASRTSQIWSRTSTDISTSRWWRTGMWPPNGITTLLLPKQCETTWWAGGSEPSSTTMRKIPK